MKTKPDELYRAAQQHLADLFAGKVKREVEAQKTWASEQKRIARQARRELKGLRRRLAECETERDELQEYLDEMLDQGEEWPGGIEETDHALEGCVNEIVHLRGEITRLEEMTK